LLTSFDILYFSTDGCINKSLTYLLTYLLTNELKLATNKTLGYDMPRVKLKMMCTARFWVDSRC